jgi:hypothetical protein
MSSEQISILTTWIIFYAVWYILNAIGYRAQFKKAGLKAGLAFIPFVREMQVYKMSWAKKNMGLYWLIGNVGGIILTFVGASSGIQILAWIGVILVTASQVLQIIRCFKQSKSFGRSGGTTAGLVFLNPIWNVVIGRSTSEYKAAVR